MLFAHAIDRAVHRGRPTFGTNVCLGAVLLRAGSRVVGVANHAGGKEFPFLERAIRSRVAVLFAGPANSVVAGPCSVSREGRLMRLGIAVAARLSGDEKSAGSEGALILKTLMPTIQNFLQVLRSRVHKSMIGSLKLADPFRLQLL